MDNSNFISIKSNWLGIDHLLKIRKDQLSFFTEILQHKKTARLRIGPYRYWVLHEPMHIESVLKLNSASTIRFERVIKILSTWNGKSLLIAEGEAWKSQRRAVLPALKNSNIENHCVTIADLTNKWIESKTSQHNSCIELDVDHEMSKLTLMIASATMFDYDISHYAEDAVHAVSTLSDTAFKEASSFLAYPDWIPTSSKRAKSKAIATMRTLVDRIIQEKFSLPIAQQPDMVRALIEKYGNDRKGIHGEVTTLLIAGHETTGAALAWSFYLMSENPQVLCRLQNEVDGLPKDHTNIFTNIKALPYLEATVKEVLRLYPPAYTLFVRRAVADFMMGNILIKKGDLLHVLPYVLHRNSSWFFEPEKCNPERFIENNVPYPAYAYLPFGGGARICLGQTFGMLELLVMTALILQKFSPETTLAKVTPEAKSSLRAEGGLPMRWKVRNIKA